MKGKLIRLLLIACLIQASVTTSAQENPLKANYPKNGHVHSLGVDGNDVQVSISLITTLNEADIEKVNIEIAKVNFEDNEDDQESKTVKWEDLEYRFSIYSEKDGTNLLTFTRGLSDREIEQGKHELTFEVFTHGVRTPHSLTINFVKDTTRPVIDNVTKLPDDPNESGLRVLIQAKDDALGGIAKMEARILQKNNKKQEIIQLPKLKSTRELKVDSFTFIIKPKAVANKLLYFVVTDKHGNETNFILDEEALNLRVIDAPVPIPVYTRKDKEYAETFEDFFGG